MELHKRVIARFSRAMTLLEAVITGRALRLSSRPISWVVAGLVPATSIVLLPALTFEIAGTTP